MSPLPDEGLLEWLIWQRWLLLCIQGQFCAVAASTVVLCGIMYTLESSTKGGTPILRVNDRNGQFERKLPQLLMYTTYRDCDGIILRELVPPQ